MPFLAQVVPPAVCIGLAVVIAPMLLWHAAGLKITHVAGEVYGRDYVSGINQVQPALHMQAPGKVDDPVVITYPSNNKLRE